MSDNANAKFRAYLKWMFAAALVVFVILWAYNQGTRDGASHESAEAS